MLRVLVLLSVLIGVAHADTATGYVRGRPRPIEVIPVDDVWLAQPTARDFFAMQAAAAQAGVALSIRSGFRDHETQIWLYRAWRAGFGNRAARPGYSLHQSGRALDLRVYDPATRAWLTKNARRYGFRRTVSDEPWHFEHVGRPFRAIKKAPRKAPAGAGIGS